VADRNLSLLVKFAALDRLTAPMRKLGGGSRALSGEIAKTKAEISKLGAAQAQVGKLKTLEARLGADTRALAKERAEVDRLKTAIAASEGPTGNMSRALANAEKASTALERRLGTTSEEIGKVGRRLEAAGVDVADLARHEDRLATRVYEATRKLKDQQAQLERNRATQERFEKTQALGSRIQSASVGAMASGTAAGLPLLAAGKSASDFQSRMTDIAQKVNLSRTAGAALGRQLDALGPKVGQLSTTLAEGLDDLAGKGLDPRVAMRMLKPIGMAATAYKAEIADLSAASFAAFDNLKVPIDQTSKVLDIMAVAGKAGAFELKDMAQYFPALTAQAQALGQRGAPAVADLAAALEIARKGTGDASTAANNIQNLLTKINTKQAIDNFAKFGVDLPASMKKAAAEGKTPMEAIAELTNKTLKGDLSKLSFLFSDMQVQGALRPLIQNLGLYRQIRADALRANGEVERDFAGRLDDANAKAARLAASAQTLGHAIGNGLLPWASAAMDRFSGLAERATTLAQRFPKITAGIATIGAASAAALVSFGALGLIGGQVVKGWGYLAFAAEKLRILRILPGLFGAVRVGMLMLARGVVRAGLMMLANPMVLVFVAIAAAIGGAAYLIYKHWDTIKAAFSSALAFISGLWTRFKEAGAHLLTGLISGITGKIAAVRDTITGLGDKVVGWFRAKLGIKSPSRVFAQLGGFMSAGLAQGLTRSAQLPVRAMRGIATGVTAAAVAAVPVIPAAAGAAPSASAPAAAAPRYEIHIYAQPGDDARAIAQAVARELDRREQRQQAERRSSYSDDA